MRKKIRIFFWTWTCILPLLSLLCVGCSDKDGQREHGIDGYIYKGQWMSLPGNNAGGWLDHMKVYGEYLYYMQYSSGRGTSLFRMCVKDKIDTGEREEYISDCSTSTEAMVDYEICENKEVYLAMKVSRKTGKWGENREETGCAVVRRLADGTESYHVYLPEVYVGDELCLTVGNGGDAFLLTKEGIYCVDPEGNVSGSISTSAYKGGGMEDFLLKGAGGKIYYCVGLMGNECSVYELIFGDEFRLESRGATPERKRCSGFFPSEYGLLCDMYDGLYQYEGEELGWRKVMRWGESGVFRSNSGFYEFVQIDKETFISMNVRKVGGDQELCLLKREAVWEQPEKEEVVLAALYPNESLLEIVAEYNQISEKYHIVVDTYEWDEVEMGLNPRLVSSHPPDLLDVSLLDIMNYAEKRIFEDLTPYLAKSSVLDSHMFLNGLLEGYTIDGRLVCIPRSFRIQAAAGRVSQLGDRMGWTMEDVMELAGKYPDQRISLYNSAQFLIKELCSRYICERYIDWGTGECRFDGEEFCRFLEWVGDNSERVMSDYSYREEYWNKERLIEKDTGSDIRCCAKMEILFGEDVTFIGDPTEDGRAVFQADPVDALCMISTSSHKEGAWAFVEYMLAYESLQGKVFFPSRKDFLEEAIKEEMTPEYHRSEDGEIIFWQGEPSEKIKCGYNGVYVYSMTQEEADTLWKVVEAVDFRPMGGVRDKVTDIILEEMEDYMDGTRSVEDVARIIQNRVRTLVQEKG